MIQKYVTQAHSHWSFCGITVMAQLKEMITEAHSRPDVKAIVIQGANGKFSGGADIGSLQSVKKEGQSTTYPHYIRGSSFFNHIIEGIA
jgi:enoyl-CoA hydratase/carnithine racemase